MSELAHQKKFSLLKFAFDLLPQLTPDIIRSEIELNRHGNVVRTRAVPHPKAKAEAKSAPNPKASEAAPKASKAAPKQKKATAGFM
jgi:hypothetical protein